MAEPDLAAQIAALLGEERLVEAAQLLREAGDHAGAADLFERACAPAEAAREAMALADPGRAFELASRDAADDELLGSVLDLLATDPARCERAAADAAARLRLRPAARAYERIGALREAGELYERSGDARSAADAFVRGGDARGAARALEAALARDKADHPCRLALGELLLERGRAEAAAHHLQQIPEAAAEYAASLAPLARALGTLGLDAARREVEASMRARGVTGGDARAAGAPSPAPAREGATIFGRYAIVREVAVTPSARVLLATDVTSGERVAVKLLAAGAVAGAGRDALARFEREARALSSLRHPNVVPLRAYLPEGPALVLAWMDGGSLADLRSRTTILPARAAEIVVAVLGALGAAHRLGIVHRDVKPSNVLFDEAGVTRLADFGAAHVGDAAATATAGVIGTLAYMSPEQREGHPATVASDVYAAGALLYDLLTGAPPAAGADRAPEPPSRLHPDLDATHDALLAALLARDPAARPAGAPQAARAITAASWPMRAAPFQPKSSAPAPPPAPGDRLVPLSPERAHDTWLGRDILVVPLDDRSLAAARAWTRAAHPALAVPYLARSSVAAIWVEIRQGTAIGGARLSSDHAETLAAALDALHRAGTAHGAVDGEHVVIGDAGASLAFAVASDGASPEGDLAALAALVARGRA